MMEINSRFGPFLRLFIFTLLVMALLFPFFSVGLTFAAEPSVAAAPPGGMPDYEAFYTRYSALEEMRVPLARKIRGQISSCKSVASDDKQLISWCKDLTRKIAPLWRTYEKDVRQYGSDLKSALISGNPESYKEKVALLLGNAFKAGAGMRAYAHQSLMSIKDMSRVLIGVWYAERGDYQRARHLANIQNVTADELKEMNDLLLSLERNKRTLLKKIIPRLVISGDFNSSIFSRYPDKFSLSLLRAHMNIKSHNYDEALKQIASARQVNIESPALDEAEVYIRQMKASAMEKHKPTAPALITHQENMAGAYAGWILGTLLMDADMDTPAALVLNRSARTLAREGNIDDSKTVFRLANKLPEGSGENKGLLPSSGIYDSASEADILLDALEYGKHDWKRSLSFLKLAHRASPDNERINEAMAHAQALMASQR